MFSWQRCIQSKKYVSEYGNGVYVSFFSVIYVSIYILYVCLIYNENAGMSSKEIKFELGSDHIPLFSLFFIYIYRYTYLLTYIGVNTVCITFVMIYIQSRAELYFVYLYIHKKNICLIYTGVTRIRKKFEYLFIMLNEA